ncbi:hypothetical protein QQX09_06100 [Demequina sp. SYSU T00192]|uniref:Uncharacterized protein n=1 Tax=Demequina litoralis TaxID=3051660 RepID=A0ABT8G8E8_9MICO|nr:hypothetical protein [Demequina sp. SYSU T00192]MDN4475423.1 hypothetical protein [Demequina sp. SYSU T00192]
MLVAKPAAAALSERASAAVVTLATTGFAVVLAHPVVLWALERFDIGWPVVFAAALLFPWAFGVIALRTPASQWVTGAPQQRSARRPAGVQQG